MTGRDLTPAERVAIARVMNAVKLWWHLPVGVAGEQAAAERVIDAVRDVARVVVD